MWIRKSGSGDFDYVTGTALINLALRFGMTYKSNIRCST